MDWKSSLNKENGNYIKRLSTIDVRKINFLNSNEFERARNSLLQVKNEIVDMKTKGRPFSNISQSGFRNNKSTHKMAQSQNLNKDPHNDSKKGKFIF